MGRGPRIARTGMATAALNRLEHKDANISTSGTVLSGTLAAPGPRVSTSVLSIHVYLNSEQQGANDSARLVPGDFQ